jgi:hypothetical protein
MEPFMIFLSGKIPLETHQSGHEVGGNGGLRFKKIVDPIFNY